MVSFPQMHRSSPKKSRGKGLDRQDSTGYEKLGSESHSPDKAPDSKKRTKNKEKKATGLPMNVRKHLQQLGGVGGDTGRDELDELHDQHDVSSAWPMSNGSAHEVDGLLPEPVRWHKKP
jgi:hypothetical protein